MDILDVIIIIALAIGIYKGYLNGFFVELTSLIGLIAAIYGTLFFSNYAGEWLREKTEWDDIYITMASFIITFVAIVMVIRYLGTLVTKVIDTAKLGTINKAAGAAFGLLKMAFLTSVFLMFINAASGEIKRSGNSENEPSFIYNTIEPIAPLFLPKLLDEADRIDSNMRRNKESNLDEDNEELQSI